MTVRRIQETENYIGLSTDIKPGNTPVGSLPLPLSNEGLTYEPRT